jgi:hemerythrin superfamily protein
VDAIQLILKDHREIDQLFESFDRAAREGDRRREGELARELVRELSVHAAIEEELLYPALREAGARDGVLDALEEHHVVKLTLKELDRMSARDERYASKVRVLADNVRQHIAREERELLPRLRGSLDQQQLRKIGDRLAGAKRAAPTRPHPAAPDTPPGIFLAGATAAVLDRGVDLVRDAARMVRVLAERGAGQGADAMREVVARTRQRGRDLLDRLARRGREGVVELRERGEQAVRRTRRRGGEALRRVEEASSAAAEQVQRKTRPTRAAGRGREGGGRPTVH